VWRSFENDASARTTGDRSLKNFSAKIVYRKKWLNADRWAALIAPVESRASGNTRTKEDYCQIARYRFTI
jgi:hypothetical protein